MPSYQIRICLESDLCVSDGSTYNSSIDTEVCHDSNGFPFLPAKRLKGVLRETAEELVDWGYPGDVEAIFGMPGKQAGRLKLGNAYLEKLDDYRLQLEEAEGSVLAHPQNVLRHFTYIRSQTALSPDTGAAKEGSLRTMRVIRRGLVFVAKAWAEKKDEEFLAVCCQAWKHLGLARTRGLGQVSAVLIPDSGDGEETLPHASWVEGSDCLEYEITLKGPVICKSVNGQEENTMDYIEGAKILGALVQRMKAQDPQELQAFLADEKLRCSNAYIAEGEQRMVEVPASLYRRKNEKDRVCDRFYETEENRRINQEENIQWNPIPHCYITQAEGQVIRKKEVEVELRYHHRRPKDKSIGRAIEEDDDSIFYQMSSIMAGQRFRGSITASPKWLEKVDQLIKENSVLSLGFSRQTEYGQAVWRVLECRKAREETVKSSDFIVKLEAPTILYDEKAMYTTRRQELSEEICAVLKIPKDARKEEQAFVNYTAVGGFQVTWGLRKPVIQAFDKGTVIRFRLSKEVDLPASGKVWIGERVSEGYGEATISISESRAYDWRLQDISKGCGLIEAKKETRLVKIGKDGLLREISDQLFDDFLRFWSAEAAWHDVGKWKNNKAAKPAVSNLLLMCSESETWDEMDQSARSRFEKNSGGKQEKLDIWKEISSSVKKQTSTLCNHFCEEYSLEGYDQPETKLQLFYLKEYLQQVKYALRNGKRE